MESSSSHLSEDEVVATVFEPLSRVLCDICIETQRDAVKSCVECLSSYCEAHLEPHHRVSGLRRHTLVEPVSSLEDRVCSQHQKPLHLFCTNEGVLLCPDCEGSHSNHRTLPLQQAHRELRAELGGTEARVTSMIKEGIQRVCSIKQSVAQRQDQTRRMFTSVKNLATLVKKMEEKQQEADSEDVTEEIEQELRDLRETQIKLKKLKQTEDPLLFLQSYPHKFVLQQSCDVSSVVLKNAIGLQEMWNNCAPHLEMFLANTNQEINVFLNRCALRRVQKCAVDFVLDPETAHPQLLLSQDLKQIRFNKDQSTTTPIHKTKQFHSQYAVLGDKGLSMGQFYFEVFVGQKDQWILGVATASVSRQIKIPQSPACGLWALHFCVDKFEAYSRPDEQMHSEKIERVGVFVDYDAGLVQFYDVNAAALLYSFNGCIFTEELYPFLNPCADERGSNLEPMIVVPVGQ